MKAHGSGQFINIASIGGAPRGADRRRLLRDQVRGAGDLGGPAPGEPGHPRHGDLAGRGRIGARPTTSPTRRARATRRYRKIAIPPDAIARAIAFAIEQPDDVDVSEIIVRPTASAF